MAKRRGPHEGSIHRRADGRWVAVLHIGWGDGRRRRKYLYGTTQRAVMEKLKVAHHAQKLGLPAGDDRITVGAYLERWLVESVEPRLRPRTAQGYRIIVERHLLPAFGRVPLVKFTPDAVQSYLNEKRAQGLSARSVRGHHAVLRAALNQALRWGLVARNVASLVTPPRADDNEVHPFSTQEARMFLDIAQGDRFETLYAITLGLGLRQGEALALSWNDVDLEQGTLTVRHTLQRYARAYHRDEPKTKRSRRTIAVPAPLVDVLRAQRIRQLEMRMRAGPAWSGNPWDLVFTTELGEPVSGSVVTHHFQRLLASAGLPRQRFHDLRHAAASFMLAQGVPLRVAMDVLGHSEIGVTANTYSHVSPEIQREATDRVSELLWGRS